jgi:colanic acid biosynthesis glycosyl transferase WcaI
MHVLLYGINFAPELTGVGKYTGEMAEWLAARRAKVTVVTAPPYYPAWRVDSPHTWHLYRKENHDGVEVVRCPLFVPRRASGLKRILHLLSFASRRFPCCSGSRFAIARTSSWRSSRRSSERPPRGWPPA